MFSHHCNNNPHIRIQQLGSRKLYAIKISFGRLSNRLVQTHFTFSQTCRLDPVDQFEIKHNPNRPIHRSNGKKLPPLIYPKGLGVWSLHDLIVHDIIHPVNRWAEYWRTWISSTKGYISIHPATAVTTKLNREIYNHSMKKHHEVDIATQTLLVGQFSLWLEPVPWQTIACNGHLERICMVIVCVIMLQKAYHTLCYFSEPLPPVEIMEKWIKQESTKSFSL